MANENFENILKEDEKIVWREKPIKQSFALQRIFYIPISFFFFFFGLLIFTGIFLKGKEAPPEFIKLMFIIMSFCFFLVGLYFLVGHIIHSLWEWKNTEYIITNKRIITKRGVIGVHYVILDLDKILQIEVHIGIVDRIFNTGSLFLLTQAGGWANGLTSGANPFMSAFFRRPPNIASIKDVFKVQKIIEEVMGK
jgi:uncharacterized membrane protein YdbT with pleckstrin-like domain